jgi:hypothetical protein
MMVNKIISGGQNGADQAALDVAIKLGISHGGWVPKGRITENGVLDDKYQVKEMQTANYNKRTEQNVIDSDGTLIISHGKLTGGSEYTREIALHYNRPWLHIDLNKTIAFQAARKIRSWIAEHGIEVLNVAGPRASKDPAIYRATADILETAFYLDFIDATMTDPPAATDRQRSELDKENLPQTVDQAVYKLLGKLTLRDKTMTANIPEENLDDLYHSPEVYIRNELSLWLSNEVLLDSCRSASGMKNLDEHSASLVILKALWRKLQTTNVLRIVK